MTAIAITDLTTSAVSGSGVFDLLMKANQAHLDDQFAKGRIKGADYATVYLGSLNAVMNAAMQFLLAKEKTGLENDLMAQQILLAQVEVQKATAQLALIEQQTANALAEHAILLANEGKITAEITYMGKQGALVDQQKTNLTAEALNIPKQGLLIDAQAAVQTQQKLNLVAEELGIDARTSLTTQQSANAVIEGQVLTATKCKLDAEFDVLLGTKLKIAEETGLLAQKTVTEKAQVLAIGVDDNSVIGKQKLLYTAQTDGFKRDAEQKAAKIMVDTWNARRMTDDSTIAGQQVDANGNPVGVNNRLGDADIAAAVVKLLQGVGAVGA